MDRHVASDEHVAFSRQEVTPKKVADDTAVADVFEVASMIGQEVFN